MSEREIGEVIAAVSSNLDADILFYSGGIVRPHDQTVIDACIDRKRKKNVLLIMVTGGGDADAGYRIARCLQTKYEKFIFYVSGYCKSTGTLVLLGANEIIFSDHGELGPLDVQMNKQDDLFQLQSGYTVMDALTALQDKAFLTFEHTFLGIEKGSEGAITVKTAGEIATNLTSGLYSNLFGQIDPLHVGEAARALSIANAYGIRLESGSKNWDSQCLKSLLSAYPSHGFVIDRNEATQLFNHVREPEGDEIALAEMIGNFARLPKGGPGDPIMSFLNEPISTTLSVVDKTGNGEGDRSEETKDSA